MLSGRTTPLPVPRCRPAWLGHSHANVRAAHKRPMPQRHPLEVAAQRQQPLQVPMQLPLLADAGDVEAALQNVGTTRLHFFVLLCVSLIWAGDAMEVMVLSYMGPAAVCEFGFSATQQSLLSSVVFGGMVLGAPAWGLAGDAFGRRSTLMASAAVVVAAGLASAAAPNYWLLLLSRAFVGFGLAAAPVAFTLMMELLPGSSRGRWGTLIELSWTAGTVAQAAAAWALLNSGWRPLLLVSVLPLALLLVLGRALPESPRYLIATRGDAPAAQAVLQRLAASSGKQLLFAEPPAATTTTRHQQQQQQQQPVDSPEASTGSTSNIADKTSCAPNDAEQQAWLLQQPSSPDTAGASSSSKTLLPTGHSSPVDATGQQPVQQLLQLQFRQLLAEARLAGRMLSRPPLASTAALVFSAWLGTAFAYYGLVQLAGELHISADAGAAAGPTCHDGVLQVPGADYLAVLLTSAAEVPAVLLATACVSVPWLGKRRSTAATLMATAACLVPCMLAAAAGGGDGSGWLATASAAGMFGARLFIMAAFTLLWVFTPDLLPTHIRASGLGLSNACARIGALLSPFAAINLVAAGAPASAEGLFAAIALATGGAVLLVGSKHDAGPMEED